MVSTRRSVSVDSDGLKGASNTKDDASSQRRGTGPRASSRTPESKSATPSRRSARVSSRRASQLPAVSESEASLPTTKTAEDANASADSPSQHKPEAEPSALDCPGGSQSGQGPEAGAPLEDGAVVEAYDVQSEGSDDSTDEDEMLQIMAAAFRAHESSKAGGTGKSSQRDEKESEATKGITPTDIAESINDLRWSPETELPPPVGSDHGLADSGRLNPIAGFSKQLHATLIDSRKEAKEAAMKGRKAEAKAWFDLPHQTLDEDMKRELRLLRLRGAYDPKRFYKTFDTTKLPLNFQVGTVVNGPADYHAGRLTKAEAKNRSITDQLLADSDVRHHRKKRYTRLQDEAERHSAKRIKGTGINKKRRKPKPKH